MFAERTFGQSASVTSRSDILRLLDLLAEQSITVLHDGEPDEPRAL
jgi:hypothetical protein